MRDFGRLVLPDDQADRGGRADAGIVLMYLMALGAF